jgi:tRNA threonylcarbamoyladenosine biosynthesis protein TsaE
VTVTVPCADPAATERLAGRLAPLLQPGDLILLEGDLGAGKTAFTQGLARALGVTEPVTSPTFVLVNQYGTGSGGELVHVDVYRLERLSEVVDLALPEMLDDGAVVVVEWGERAAGALPPDHLHIRIAIGTGDERTFVLDPRGEGWAQRLAAVAVT